MNTGGEPDPYASKDKVKEKILSCLTGNKDDFRKNQKGVVERIKQGDKNFISLLVEIVGNYIPNKNESSIKRYYALYLLKLGMDSKNPELVVGVVKKKILKALGELGKKKVNELFTKENEQLDDNVAEGFMTLLLECLHHWNLWFGYNPADNSKTKYRVIFEEVAAKTKFPTEFIYFKEKKKDAEKTVDSDRPKDDKKGSNNMNKSQSQTISNKNPKAKTVLELIKRADTQKEILLGFVSASGRPDLDVMTDALREIDDLMKVFNKNAEEVLGIGDETLTSQFFDATSVLSNILEAYDNYRQDQKFPKFKQSLINILGKSTPTPTPDEPKQKSESVAEKSRDRSKSPKNEKNKSANDGFGDFAFNTNQNRSQPVETDAFSAQPFNTVPIKVVDRGDPFGGFNFKPKAEEPSPTTFKTTPANEDLGAFSSDPFGLPSKPAKQKSFTDFETEKPAEKKNAPTWFEEEKVEKKPPVNYEEDYQPPVYEERPEPKVSGKLKPPPQDEFEEKKFQTQPVETKSRKSFGLAPPPQQTEDPFKPEVTTFRTEAVPDFRFQDDEARSQPPKKAQKSREVSSFSGFEQPAPEPRNSGFGDFDNFSERPEPKKPSPQSMRVADYPPENKDPDYNISTIIARNILTSKYEELESDRLRKERDAVFSELEKIKREHSSLQVENEYLKREHDGMNSEFQVLKNELQQMKRIQSDQILNLEHLRVENENFKKLKASLQAENESHLRQMDELYREIAKLKENIVDYDAREKRYRNDNKVQELESTLRSTQDQFNSLQEVYNKMNAEYEQVNNELERLRNANMKDAAAVLAENFSNMLGQHFANPGVADKSPLNAALFDLKKNYLYEGGGLSTRLDAPKESPRRSSYVPTTTNYIQSTNNYMPSTSSNLQSFTPAITTTVTNPIADSQLAHANELIEKARKLRQESYVPNITPRNSSPANIHEFQPMSFIPGPSSYTSPIIDIHSKIQPYSNDVLQPNPIFEYERRNFTLDQETRTFQVPREIERRVYSPAKDTQLPTIMENKSFEFKPSNNYEINTYIPTTTEPNKFNSEFTVQPTNLNISTPDPSLQRAANLLAEARRLREGGGVGVSSSTSFLPNTFNQPVQNEFRIKTLDELGAERASIKEPKDNLSTILNTKYEYKATSPLKNPTIEIEAIEANPAGIRRNRNDQQELGLYENVSVIQRDLPKFQINEIPVRSRSPIKQEDIVAQKILSEANNVHYVQETGYSERGYTDYLKNTISPNSAMKKINFNRNKSISKADDVRPQEEDLKPFDAGKISQVTEQGVYKKFEIIGSGLKQKVGRSLQFDNKTFDQLVNAIYSNTYGKDVDNYKFSCLVNKAALFDSQILQVGVISKLEQSLPNPFIRLVLHYGNKSPDTLTNFGVDPLQTTIKLNPEISKTALVSKAQMKQEIVLDFVDFKHITQVIQVSFILKDQLHRLSLPLPATLNKFMAFKFVDGNSFKQRWKSAKASALKIGYRNFNAKFIKNPADINRFFDGCLVDITPADNPKGKTKLGTVYILPDGQTHVVKFSLDRSRMKIYVGTDNYNKQYAEWAAQHFAFLLTVE